ncbi:MAG: hypothetical protein KDI55_19625, partial [Anaerolineae bacterium]|nr:hypothetical protein [Anaerolineae bacterium]
HRSLSFGRMDGGRDLNLCQLLFKPHQLGIDAANASPERVKRRTWVRPHGFVHIQDNLSADLSIVFSLSYRKYSGVQLGRHDLGAISGDFQAKFCWYSLYARYYPTTKL